MAKLLLLFIIIWCSTITTIKAQCVRNDSHYAICTAQKYITIPTNLQPTITALILSHNNISSLNKDVLTRYSLVEELHLDNNHITSIHSIKEISAMKKLTVLNLTKNYLMDLDFRIFAMNIHLEKLVIDNNFLTDINDKPTNLRNLKVISMNNNKLTRFTLVAFKHFFKLQSLDLRENRLTCVPADIHEKLSNLHELLLDGNPLTNSDSRLCLQKLSIVDGNLKKNLTDNEPNYVAIEKTSINVSTFNLNKPTALENSTTNTIPQLRTAKSSPNKIELDAISHLKVITENVSNKPTPKFLEMEITNTRQGQQGASVSPADLTSLNKDKIIGIVETCLYVSLYVLVIIDLILVLACIISIHLYYIRHRK